MTALSDLIAPSLEDFERMAAEAFAALPAFFRQRAADVAIIVEDFPTDEIVEEMDVDSPFDLMGLFEGRGLAQGGGLATSGILPNRVFLYRRPILDYWAEHEETLGAIVTHVLVHEIGHHFGLSDADMEAIEARETDNDNDNAKRPSKNT